MALVTGGMSGMGLVASYEHAMQGRDRIIAVSRSAFLIPGEQEAHLLDVIQDIAQHYIIRCDIADSGAWSDTLAFANNINANEEEDPTAVMKDAQVQLKEMDSLDVIGVLLSSLQGMLEAGVPIDGPKLQRILYFRNNMSRGLAENFEKLRVQPVDDEVRQRLLGFQEQLQELSEIIDMFRSRGLVEEQPGAPDTGPLGGIFPGENTTRAGEVPYSEQHGPFTSFPGEKPVQGHNETQVKDALLQRMEKELATQKSTQIDGCHTEAGQPQGEPQASPKVSHFCAACGKECAESRTHCANCQRATERAGLESAIRKSKEEAQLKARRAAERKAERAEAERRAKEEAEQKAKEEEEYRAKAELEQKAREEAAQKAKAEAERRAREEELRRARDEAEREEAERQAKEEAYLKSLDDVVCPAGHALQKFTVSKGFPCDLCDADSVEGAVMLGCRHKDARGSGTCSFDICEQCSKTRLRRNLQAKGEAV